MQAEKWRIQKGYSYRKMAKRFGVTLNKIFYWCKNPDAEVKKIKGVNTLIVNKVVAEEVKSG